jgi:hypothetical protein
MGVVFVLVAIWGFIDGDNVLIFPVNTAHNLVHLLSGLAALAFGFYFSDRAARGFSLAFGLVYGLVAVLGFMHVGFVSDLLNLHGQHSADGGHGMANQWLHALIAAVFLIAALLPERVRLTGTTPTTRDDHGGAALHH